MQYAPRISRFFGTFCAVLLALTFIFAATLKSQELDKAETRTEAAPPLSKKEAFRLYIKNHVVTQSDTVSVLVTRVVDGDTFVCVSCLTCKDSISVRVLGLDTFEKHGGKHLRRQADEWDYTERQVKEKAVSATNDAKKLLLRQQVTLYRDKGESNIDIYFRPLRYVRLPDGRDYTQVMQQEGHDSHGR